MLSCSYHDFWEFGIYVTNYLRLWEDNIKIDIGEIGFGDVDWIHLAQDRDMWWALVNMVMSIWVP
jgi:hypothetical protein